jgi:heme exporter protein D
VNASSSKTSWVVRVAALSVAFFVALQVGMTFLPTWAAYVAAAVGCLVLQEVVVLVAAEVKGRKQKEDV